VKIVSGAHYVTVVNSSTVIVAGTAISSGQTFTKFHRTVTAIINKTRHSVPFTCY
jgi:hypothetical protein